MYICPVPNSPFHSHALAAEGRACWQRFYAPAPVQPIVPSAPVRMATVAQLEYIIKLGGTPDETLTIRQASSIIEALKKGTAPVTSTYQTPNQRGQNDPRLPMLTMLVKSVPLGYFAVREQEGAPITFMRISKPKSGKYVGGIKVQTQHGPRLETDAMLWERSGTWSFYRTASPTLDALMLLCADYHNAARLYAKELGRCCRCNTELTDERSRHYGIGPICDKQWGWIINEVDDENDGLSFEQLQHRNLLASR